MSLCSFLRHYPRYRTFPSTFPILRTSSVSLIALKGPSKVALPTGVRGFRSTCHAKDSHSHSKPPFSGKDILNFQRWETRTKIAVVAFAAGTVYYLYHLEQVPETGRWRFMDISPERERLRAKQAHQELLAAFEGNLVPQDHPISRHVRRVVNRLLENSQLGRLKDEPSLAAQDVFGTPGDTWSDDRPYGPRSEKDWHVLVVNDPKMVNAMAGDGTVVVFTGILPICKDENGLAAVLGHEIAHAVARHTSEKLSSMRVFVFLAWFLNFIFPIDFDLANLATTYALHSVPNLSLSELGGSDVLVNVNRLPNSRTQELEADRIGLTLTAKACYDPMIVPEMQKRLASIEKKLGRSNIEFFATHPTSERRAQILEAFLPDAYAIQAASSLCAGMQDNLNAFRDAFAPESKSSSDGDSAWV